MEVLLGHSRALSDDPKERSVSLAAPSVVSAHGISLVEVAHLSRHHGHGLEQGVVGFAGHAEIVSGSPRTR